MSDSVFLRRLEESGLVDGTIAELRKSLPEHDDDQKLAALLTERGVISEFQADTILTESSLPLIIGEYEVLDMIGRGGMGYVLKARHRTMNRHVAIKFLLPLHTESDDLKQRFAREVETAAQLEHPNIVPAYDAGTHDDGSMYLVMKYIPGKDLRTKVKEEGPLSPFRAVDVICQAATGLALAHEQGVVHRDIKPSNLLMDGAGIVRVLDLGLARIKPSPGDADSADLTNSGSMMGTVDYMSPEQAIDARSADHRSDIYSLGCTLFFLLIGKGPFASDSMMKRLLAHRESPIPKLGDLRDVPDELEAVYQKMMAKNPDDRPQSMQEVLDALERIELDDDEDAANVGTIDMTDDGTGSFIQLPEDDTLHTDRAIKQSDTDPDEFANDDAPTLTESTSTALREEDFSSQTVAMSSVPATLAAESGKETADAVPGKRSSWGVISAAGVLIIGLCAVVFVALNRDDTEPPVTNLPGPDITTEGDDGPSIAETVGDTQQSERHDTALYFDGQTSAVRLKDLTVKEGQPVTIEAIVTSAGMTGVVVAVPPLELDCNGWRWQTRAGAANPEWTEYFHNGDEIVAGQKEHMAAVFDGREIRIYCNGKLSDRLMESWDGTQRRSAGTIEGDVTWFGIEAWLGIRPPDMKPSPFGHFHGLIHELKISGVVREQQQLESQERFTSDDDTLALYHFDEATGTVLTDASGNGHDGVIEGAAWVDAGTWKLPPVDSLPTSEERFALEFDGESSGVRLAGLTFDGSHPLTVEVVAAPAGRKDGPLVTTSGLDLIWNGYRWEAMATIGESDRHSVRRSGPIQPVGKASHVAMVYDGSKIELFVDGVRSETPMLRKVNGSPEPEVVLRLDEQPVSTGEIYIGRKVPTSKTHQFFSGRIHQVRISRVARTESELQPRRQFESDDQTLALYRFNEGQGTTLADSSGNDHVGDIAGATWISVPQDEDAQPDSPQDQPSEEYALEFDGKSSGVSVESLHYDGSHPLTIEAVVNASGKPPGTVVHANGLTCGSHGDTWETLLSVSPHGFKRTGRSVVVNERVRLAAVYDGDTLQIYCDGVPATGSLRRREGADGEWSSVEKVDGTPKDWNARVQIGRLTTGADYRSFFNGQISELRISNVARSVDDLQREEPFESDQHTLALYHFDEGQGETLKDSSGNGHDGKIIGARWVPRDVTNNATAQSDVSGTPVSNVKVIARDGLEWIPGLLDLPKSPPGVRRWQLDTLCSRAKCHDIAWSPRGDLIAVAAGRAIHIRDAEDLSLQYILLGNEHAVTSVSWHSDGNRLVSLARDQRDEHIVWNLQDGSFDVHSHPPFGIYLAVSPHDDIIAMAGWDGRLILFDMSGTELMRSHLPPGGGFSAACAWSPDGKRVALWRLDGIAIFDAVEQFREPIAVLTSPLAKGIQLARGGRLDWSGEDEIAFTAHERGLAFVDVAIDATTVLAAETPFKSLNVSTTTDGRAVFCGEDRLHHIGICAQVRNRTVIGARTQKPPLTRISPTIATCIAWNPEGSRFVSGSTAGTVTVLDEQGTPVVSTREMGPQRHHGLKWNSEGTRFLSTVAFLDTDYTVWLDVWSSTGERVRAQIGLPTVWGSAWNRAGTEFAALLTDHDISIYDRDGGLLRKAGLPPKSSHRPLGLDWHPEREAFVVGNTDGTVTLFADGQTTVIGNDVDPRRIAFDRDGQSVLTAANNGQVTRWFLDGTRESLGQVGPAPDSIVEGDTGSLLIPDHAAPVILTEAGDIVRLPSVGMAVAAMDWTKSGTIVAAGHLPEFVELTTDGEVLRRRRFHDSSVRSLSISQNNNRMVSGGAYDSELECRDVTSGDILWKAVLFSGDGYLTFDANGELLHGDRELTKNFYCLVEREDGSVSTMSLADFRSEFFPQTE